MESESRPRPLTTAGSRLDRPLPFSARTGCLLSLLLGAVVLCLGLAAFQLVFRGGLSLRMGQLREVRLWLVQDEDSQGLGISRTQRVSGSERSGEVCVRTLVDFWLWSGAQADLNAAFCDCYEKSGSTWISIGTCPE